MIATIIVALIVTVTGCSSISICVEQESGVSASEDVRRALAPLLAESL